jgi:hypothetical protein
MWDVAPCWVEGDADWHPHRALRRSGLRPAARAEEAAPALVGAALRGIGETAATRRAGKWARPQAVGVFLGQLADSLVILPSLTLPPFLIQSELESGGQLGASQKLDRFR